MVENLRPQPAFLGRNASEVSGRDGTRPVYRIHLSPSEAEASKIAAKALRERACGRFALRKIPNQPSDKGWEKYEISANNLDLFSRAVESALSAAAATGQEPGKERYQTVLQRTIDNIVG